MAVTAQRATGGVQVDGDRSDQGGLSDISAAFACMRTADDRVPQNASAERQGEPPQSRVGDAGGFSGLGYEPASREA